MLSVSEPRLVYEIACPPRPSIPLLCWVFAGSVAESSLLLHLAPIALSADDWHLIVLIAVLTTCACTVLVARYHPSERAERTHSLRLQKASRIRRALCGALVGACIGLIASECYLAQGMAAAKDLAHANISSWSFVATADSKQTRFGYRCRAEAHAPSGQSLGLWLSLPEPVHYGDKLILVGRYKPLVSDEWGYLSRLQGSWGEVSVRFIRSKTSPTGLGAFPLSLRNHALQRFEPSQSESRAVLAGAVCGYRSSIDEMGLQELFSACGVSHLLAVSGGHIAIISSFLLQFAKVLRLGPKARAALSLGFSALFVISCGAPASAIRSWIMAAVSALSWCFGRRKHTLSAVSFVALFMSVVNPGLIGQLGFQLSVLSVMGLSLFSAYSNYVLNVLGAVRFRLRLPLALRRVGKELRLSCAASLVCQGVTLPVTLPLFSLVSVVAPLANCIVMLPFTALVSCGALAVCFADSAPACKLLLVFCDVAAHIMLVALRALAAVPLACISIDFNQRYAPLLIASLYGALTLLYCSWPRLKRTTFAAAGLILASVLLIFFVRWRYFAPARLVILDVGQGDAILVQEGASAILVDTGPSGVLPSALARQHVYHLDAIVLTHQHDDHVGGLQDLAYKMPCEQVFVAEGVRQHLAPEIRQNCKALCNNRLFELNYGDSFEVGSFTLRTIWPHEDVTGLENRDSLEFAVNYHSSTKQFRALLTGDAEKDELASILASGDIGKIDLLKLGHHGSKVSLTQDQAQMLLPKLCVASAGAHNRYGHPSPECQEIAHSIGAQFACTIDCGDITVVPAAGGLRVSFQKRCGN